MKSIKHSIPRIAIRSISGGLLLMALFTMMWVGVAQAGLQGKDHRAILIIASIICAIFIFHAVKFFKTSKKFPVFTNDADALEGKKTSKAFGIIFGIEGVAIPLVSGMLVAFGYEDLIMPAIAMVVGLHFYPMARIFNRTIDYYLATWTCLIALTCMIIVIKVPDMKISMLGFLGVCVAVSTTTYGFYMIRSANEMIRKSLPD